MTDFEPMEEADIVTALEEMGLDKELKTSSSYVANANLWPENQISFIEKHLIYLRTHPNVNPRHYLSNLRLMIKKRP